MVTPLKFFSQDPNNKGRPAGKYYLRKRGQYSWYNDKRDEIIKASGFQADKIGKPRNSKYLHITDGIIPIKPMPENLFKTAKSKK